MTQNTVRDVLGAITSSAPNATPASALAAAHDALTQGRTHLQDLGPDDLPEQSRGQITKEIAFFREQAAKREQARRDQADKERNAAPGNAHSGGTGSSAPSRDARDRFGRPDSRGPPPPSSGGRYGDDSAHRQPEMGRSQRQWGRPQTEDPQSYRNGTTPGFVRGSSRSQQDEAAREEQDVYSQQDHQKRRREQMFRDRERQWEHREKQRAHHNQREVARDNGMARDEEAGAKSMLRRLEDWDEQSEARDPFYSDRYVLSLQKRSGSNGLIFSYCRNRWRAQRRAFRAREKDNDAQDARREKEQLAEIQKQSDAFLASQSDIFASLSGQPGKKTGGAAKDEDGTASGGPIKLGDRSKAKAKPAEQPEKPKPRAAAFASAEDEEEQGRKKRQLIPLDYSELEHGEDAGLTDQQIADRRKKRIQEIVTSIPTDKNGLWTWTVDWAYLTDVSFFRQDKCGARWSDLLLSDRQCSKRN